MPVERYAVRPKTGNYHRKPQWWLSRQQNRKPSPICHPLSAMAAARELGRLGATECL